MIPSNQISLLSPLLVGIATILCTIIIHALILGVIIRAVRRDLQEGRVGVGFWRDSIFVTNATLLASKGGFTTKAQGTKVGAGTKFLRL